MHAQTASGPPPAADPMLALLRRRVAEEPGRADCWRLIGRILDRRGEVNEAATAFRRALDLSPDNAAAHSDYGELLFRQGNRQAALLHFDQVFYLAPESSYAEHLWQNGFRPSPAAARPAPSAPLPAQPEQFELTRLPPVTPLGITESNAEGENPLQPVGYEIQTFDGSTNLESSLQELDSLASMPPRNMRAFVEFGALYNTNVTLTPTSRELSGDGPASFQGFLSPDLEWITMRGETWRSGPLVRGYFTLNEDAYSDLNLASFQPGAFAERDCGWGETAAIGRLEYVYTLDLLGGNRFGERHALTASLMVLPLDADVLYSYITASSSDFADDGIDPDVTSLDGPALSFGIARFCQTHWQSIPTWSYGIDFQSAMTDGADYRFHGVTLHGDCTFRLGDRLSFIPSANIGYRDYGDYTGPVSRNELTSRVAGKLRWQLNDAWALSLVVSHDRFASPNDDFDGDRTEAGVVATLLY